MEIVKHLAEELRVVRTESLKITQKELSEKLNVSVVYLSYLEKGKKIPSVDFLENLYSLLKRDVPTNVKQLLLEAKKEKKKENFVNTPSNIVYRLEEQGVYSYTKLKLLLKKNPDNLTIIYGMLTILIKDNKLDEAKKLLLQSLINIKKLEEKKWLEATYYELEGNFPFAIQLMKDAIKEFDNQYQKLDDEKKQAKARLIFENACIHFKYAQNLYYEEKKDEAINNFKKALAFHEQIKNLYKEAYYQMDYAGIFFWLALLGVDSKENWANYIREVKLSLVLNYHEFIKIFDNSKARSLYSKPYIISTVSFIARAYAQLAKFEENTLKQDEYLGEGEFLFAQYTPVNLVSSTPEYYRYCFNQACFYSLKAEIKKSRKELFEDDLKLCHKILIEAGKSDNKNKVKLFEKDLNSSEALSFFRKTKQKECELITRNLK